MSANPPYTDAKYWINGLLAKPKYRLPSLKTYFKNLKRVIEENQTLAFSIVASDEAITLPVFNAESIHFGISKDLNAQALYISGRIRTSTSSGNFRQDEVETKFVATTGPQDTFDDAYKLSLCYLTGLQMILEAMDSRELTLGWRNDPYVQPNIKLGDSSATPQVTVLTAELGAIPELSFFFRVGATRNN